MRNGVQYGVDTADVLSTVAECDASASGGKGTTQVASAKALSELNSNFDEELGSRLGGIRFGIDEDGNYGYKKVGADTVTPFSRDINIGDNFTVTLTGSHNKLTTASVCYIDKTTIYLLGDVSLGNANCSTQCGYIWNYSVEINGKEYTGTCKIPTHQQIYSKCAGYRRDFNYWLSTYYNDSYYWYVYKDGSVAAVYTGVGNAGTLPFIEITL